MINPHTTYLETGRKTARAVNHNDLSLAQFLNDWFSRALKLETKENQIIAKEYWHKGYKEESLFRPLEYFK